jgi:hypothetical protein
MIEFTNNTNINRLSCRTSQGEINDINGCRKEQQRKTTANMPAPGPKGPPRPAPAMFFAGRNRPLQRSAGEGRRNGSAVGEFEELEGLIRAIVCYLGWYEHGRPKAEGKIKVGGEGNNSLMSRAWRADLYHDRISTCS